MSELIEVELARIVIQEKGHQQYIHLREKDGERAFPIVIGFNEAAEINRKLLEEVTRRPMTHDLVGRILETLKWRLKHVIINELKQSTFYALLVLVPEAGEEERLVDSRPSDAIALAVQTGARIYVNREVMDLVSPG
jgi:bifunctional DNase/RNase